MVDEQEWGDAEYQARLADIAAVKRGEMTLEDAQKRARKRQRQSGMTPSVAYRAMTTASRASRRTS